MDEWVHTACVLWSDGVQLAKDGLLENASQIIEKSVNNVSLLLEQCMLFRYLPIPLYRSVLIATKTKQP